MKILVKPSTMLCTVKDHIMHTYYNTNFIPIFILLVGGAPPLAGTEK